MVSYEYTCVEGPAKSKLIVRDEYLYLPLEL
jgi:hypothetical protein